MIDTSGNNPVIQVNMFGGFTITMDNRTMSDSDNRSRKAWSLLSYLIVNRRKDVSINELFNAIWQEGMQDNPYGALKTLVFRVRKMMEAAGFPSQELILNQKGAYMWNPSWKLTIDTDRFEFLCKRILNSQDDMGNLEPEWREALGLYKGTFLPKSADESWVNPLHTYYHSLYQKLVYKTVDLLLKKENFSLITSICQTAVGIEPFDEEFHYYLVYSLYRDGHTSQAIEEYNHTMDLFYNEFSISPSDHFKDLYKTIRSKEQGINTNLDSIQETLREEASGGAFYCEYPVFHDLFQLERRAIERTGDSIYLCLLTVSDLDGHVPKLAVLNKSMEHLNNAVRNSLRCSDVYTRYSISQYIILLPTVTAEKGEMVLKRIISNFHKQYNRKDLTIEYKLQPVLPWERAVGALMG